MVFLESRLGIHWNWRRNMTRNECSISNRNSVNWVLTASPDMHSCNLACHSREDDGRHPSMVIGLLANFSVWKALIFAISASCNENIQTTSPVDWLFMLPNSLPTKFYISPTRSALLAQLSKRKIAQQFPLIIFWGLIKSNSVATTKVHSSDRFHH